MSGVDGEWPTMVIPQCHHIKVSVVFFLDTPMKSIDALQVNGNTYILRRSLGQTWNDYVTVRLCSRLRLLFNGGGLYEPGEEYAIKIWNAELFKESPSMSRDELAIMQLLHAVGDIRFNRLVDFFKDDTFVYMVMPYMVGGDLWERLGRRTGPMPEDEARDIMFGIMAHLAFMKQHGIAHRNVSLENVMMGVAGSYNTIDLGMSVRHPAFVGGRECYRDDKPIIISPEVAQGEGNADPFASDIWALGVIMYILLTRSPIYTRVGDPYYIMVCEGKLGELLDHYNTQGLIISPLARSMIIRMLDINPLTRLTLQQAIEHPWIQAKALRTVEPRVLFVE